jgi:hypothetical protein
MIHRLRFLTGCFAIVGLVLLGGHAVAQPNDKNNGHDPKGQTDTKPSHEKQHKNFSGKDLVGDNIKKNGSHKLQDHGKYSAFVNVSNGKVAGVDVKHSEKGRVAVTKYKTTQKMAEGPTSGIQLASFVLAQSQYVGTLWIGYAYYDDYGDEIIYWFPYDMILDGDTGAIEYYPS